MAFKGKVFSSVIVNWKETKTEKEFTDINEYNNYIKENHLNVELPEFKIPSFESIFPKFDSLFSNFESIFNLPTSWKLDEFKEYEDQLKELESEKVQKEKVNKLVSYRDRFKKVGRDDKVKEIDEKIKKLSK